MTNTMTNPITTYVTAPVMRSILFSDTITFNIYDLFDLAKKGQIETHIGKSRVRISNDLSTYNPTNRDQSLEEIAFQVFVVTLLDDDENDDDLLDL